MDENEMGGGRGRGAGGTRCRRRIGHRRGSEISGRVLIFGSSRTYFFLIIFDGASKK